METTIQFICDEIRLALETQKDSVVTEMRNYPTPVAGCDTQFNYLIEQRDKLFRDLSRLNTICQSDCTQAETFQLLDAFIQSSAIGAETLERVRQQM